MRNDGEFTLLTTYTIFTVLKECADKGRGEVHRGEMCRKVSSHGVGRSVKTRGKEKCADKTKGEVCRQDKGSSVQTRDGEKCADKTKGEVCSKRKGEYYTDNLTRMRR